MRKNWKLAPLASVSDIVFCTGGNNSEPARLKVPTCGYTDVYSNWCISPNLPLCMRNASESELARFHLSEGDVLVTRDSESAEDIARAAVAMGDVSQIICGDHLARIRPHPGTLHGPFLAKLFETLRFRKQFIRKAHGVTRFGLTMAAFETAQIPIPPYPEQVSAARFLVCCDHELSVTRAQVELLHRKKRAGLLALLSRNWQLPTQD